MDQGKQGSEAKPATDDADPRGPSRPVGLALRLVERVAEWQPVGASDLARRLALPKATVHRLLLALETFGWLERDGGSRRRDGQIGGDLGTLGHALPLKTSLC